MRKGQHGVGLTMKEDINENSGKDGILIYFINTFLLKTRISIK